MRMRRFQIFILMIIFMPLSTALASDTHISAPVWQSSGSVSISHELVRVRLDLMSVKKL